MSTILLHHGGKTTTPFADAPVEKRLTELNIDFIDMTRIRQVAPLLHIINFNNLCFRVENETTLISAKNRVDLISISEVRSYITEWPRFFGPPCISELAYVTKWRLDSKSASTNNIINCTVTISLFASAKMTIICMEHQYRYFSESLNVDSTK